MAEQKSSGGMSPAMIAGGGAAVFILGVLIPVILVSATIGLAAKVFTDLPVFGGFFKVGASVTCKANHFFATDWIIPDSVGNAACSADELAKAEKMVNKEFAKNGLVDPLKAGLSCANWNVEQLGPIPRDKNGKATECLDATNSGDRTETIPAWLISVYRAAGAEYNVPWQLLAAINWNDTEFGALDTWKQQKGSVKNRVGWIPLTSAEWKGYGKKSKVRNLSDADKAGFAQDAGNAAPSFFKDPYTTKASCPLPAAVDEKGKTIQGGAPTSGGNGRVKGLPGPLTGVATFYNPKLSGINGTEGGGSFAKTYARGWAAAKLGSTGVPPGWNFPSSNHKWHGILVKVTNTKNGRSVEVPISDIGPGGPPINGRYRVIDLLPGPSEYLTQGKPGTIGEVKLEPIKRLTQAETAKYANGSKTGYSGSGSLTVNVPVTLSPDNAADTCDPVDSIFALAAYLSDKGAQGRVWQAALPDSSGQSNSAEIGGTSGYTWPGKNHQITSSFGPRKSPCAVCSSNHQGLDLAAVIGTPVFAVADGEVTISGPTGGYGNYICIRHDARITSCVGHNSKLLKKVGQKVKQGDKISLAGSTGNSTGPHLHFEILLNGVRVDPLPYLKGSVGSGGKGKPVNTTKVSTGGGISRMQKTNQQLGKTLRFDAKLKEVARPSAKSCASGDPPTATKLIPVFQAAAATFNLDWHVLAGITTVESGLGCNTGRSSAAAYGWTQFIDPTWASYGVDANSDGKADRLNAIDAIFSTARYLSASGAPKSYYKAIFAYNHADWYVAKVLSEAKRFGGGVEVVKELNDLTAKAVQKRNHAINRNLCPDAPDYKTCIASLYAKLTLKDEQGNETPDSSASGVLGGGCGDISGSLDKVRVAMLPDLKKKGLVDNRIVQVKGKNKAYTSRNTWARRDAAEATKAVLTLFQSCHPELKKHWKDISIWDFGAGAYGTKFGIVNNGHLSHRNGADVDINVSGVTNFNLPGPYHQKWAAQLAAMFYRAGANWIFFDDPTLQKWVNNTRSRLQKNQPKLTAYKSFQTRAMFTTPSYGLHFNHFHVRWNYAGSTTSTQKDIVKVYLNVGTTPDAGLGENPVQAGPVKPKPKPKPKPKAKAKSKSKATKKRPRTRQPRYRPPAYHPPVAHSPAYRPPSKPPAHRSPPKPPSRPPPSKPPPPSINIG